MGTFRLSAWCLDPALIPREMDLHIIEPDEPPSLEDMAAPAQAVVPPHINTLAYPLLIHVTSTVDFRRSTPRHGAGDRTVDGDRRTPAWPTQRQYSYTRGVPDVLPGSAEGGSGGAPSSSAGQGGGGHGGSVRVLASRAVVGETVAVPPQRSKRRRRGGRKIREIRARAAAEATGGDAGDVLAAVGAEGEREAAASATATSAHAAVDTPVHAAADPLIHGPVHRSVKAAGGDAGEVLAAVGAEDDREAAASATATGAAIHAPVHAVVDPLVHGPVHHSVDRVLVIERPVVGDACARVGSTVGLPVLERSGSNKAAGGRDGERSFRVGALAIPFPALACESVAVEPPSLQTLSLDEVAGPFVPRPLLGLEAFASPAPPDAHSVGPGEADRPLG
ncbi:hypothetical protein ACQ4PT_038384 [Festuca glaucescens]